MFSALKLTTSDTYYLTTCLVVWTQHDRTEQDASLAFRIANAAPLSISDTAIVLRTGLCVSETEVVAFLDLCASSARQRLSTKPHAKDFIHPVALFRNIGKKDTTLYSLLKPVRYLSLTTPPS